MYSPDKHVVLKFLDGDVLLPIFKFSKIFDEPLQMALKEGKKEFEFYEQKFSAKDFEILICIVEGYSDLVVESYKDYYLIDRLKMLKRLLLIYDYFNFANYRFSYNHMWRMIVDEVVCYDFLIIYKECKKNGQNVIEKIGYNYIIYDQLMLDEFIRCISTERYKQRTLSEAIKEYKQINGNGNG